MDEETKDSSKTLIMAFDSLPDSLKDICQLGLSNGKLYANIRVEYHSKKKTDVEILNQLETLKKEFCRWMGKLPSEVKIQITRLDDA